MRDNTDLIEEAIEFTGPVGFEYDSDWDASQANDMIDQLSAALVECERELTKLGTAFRDYKIVHPEGTQ